MELFNNHSHHVESVPYHRNGVMAYMSNICYYHYDTYECESLHLQLGSGCQGQDSARMIIRDIPFSKPPIVLVQAKDMQYREHMARFVCRLLVRHLMSDITGS